MHTIVKASLTRKLNIFNRFITESRFTVQLIGKCRRFLTVNFRDAYVQEQMQKRMGECRQCGKCCSLLFTCPMLTRDGLCLIYGDPRPKACKKFPINQSDIEEISLCGGSCGYKFGKEN